MGYRFKLSDPFTGEFQRIAGEQLNKARHLLLDQPGGLDNAIHDTRKCFKRLRGLYRMIEKDAPDFRKTENARLRDAARSLSAARDATVLAETAASLQRSAANNHEAAVLERTARTLSERRDRLVESSAGLQEKADDAAAACTEAISAIRKVRLKDGPKATAKRVAKAWKKSVVKGHAALETCKTEATASDFHELRKCCQTHRFYLKLLQPLWPSMMRAKGAAAKDLAERLGQHNDLAVFAALMNGEPGLFGTGEERSLLSSIVHERQAGLRDECLKMAKLIFGGKPEEEGAIVSTLWKRAAG